MHQGRKRHSPLMQTHRLWVTTLLLVMLSAVGCSRGALVVSQPSAIFPADGRVRCAAVIHRRGGGAINPEDLRIDVFRSSGPGGQSVNTTYSAVRITHLPTNTVVSCQDEKSQIKNRAKAMRVLRSRLYEMKLQEQQKQITQERRSMIGTGDRSEKIRTYNFPQNRVTDHRIGLTLHQLDRVMDGKLDEVVEALIAYYEAENLKQAAVTA